MAAAKSTKRTTSSDAIEILQVDKRTMDVFILGTSPIILNRMSEKARHELLLPRAGRLTAVEKANRLKHNPREEYRQSAYTLASGGSLLAILSTAFKGAMANAALDLPGTKKAQIGRLCFVEGDYVEIYGIPQLFISTVRSADMNRTPDQRTRAIVPEWACRLSISWIEPLMRQQAVANLLAAAGMYIGVGDWRPEKGKGSYGRFELVSSDNKAWAKIVKAGGRKAQEKALAEPECYDNETADLLAWFDQELHDRTLRGKAEPLKGVA